MKTSLRSTLRPGWRTLAPALLAFSVALSAPCARADVIDFEQIVNYTSPADTELYLGGDRFSTGDYLAVVADSAHAQALPDYEPGLAGAVIPKGPSSSCWWIGCPEPISQYYMGLNDGSLTLSRQDDVAFHLSSLSYGAISHDHEGAGGHALGQLRITGTRADGSIVAVSTDLPELYYWGEWTLDASFAAIAFTSVTIDACAYTARGECLNGPELLNASQFALDNVHVSPVPEPSTVALLSAGLLLVGARRRLGGPA